MYMVDKVVKLKHQKAHDSRLYSIQLVSERQREIDEHQLGIRCFIVVIIKALYELVMFAKKKIFCCKLYQVSIRLQRVWKYYKKKAATFINTQLI